LKWLGRKNVVWFVPPKKHYRASGVEVIVNPELGLSFNGQSHLIKLYFKEDELDRFRVDVILALMEHVLRPHCGSNELMSVHDCRRSKVFSWRPSTKPLMAQVDAELAYIAALWPSV
jgi:hypothetical protein